MSLRPLLLQGSIKYQLEYHYAQQVTHENLDKTQAIALCLELIVRDFKQINLFTSGEDVQVLASNPANPKISKKPATKVQGSLEHNQPKKYIIPDKTPCDFLIRLGVMGEDGKVFQKHYSKFRQINRFLEIVQDAFGDLPDCGALKIIDFGCGKAYLTFALYYYLKILQGRSVEIIGLDLKQDVIEFCNRIATDLNYDELRFEVGDIAEYSADHADMVVTLHACDTATDYALINAVKWHAKVILSVPCCQHELFSQIQSDLNDGILKHGILKDRFTEILTDALRGLKLESCGYEVSMIEFTSLEHTAKNIMIKAVLADHKKTDERIRNAAESYERLKKFWNVNEPSVV